MAQLPRIQPSQSLIAAPRSSVTPQDVANPYQQVANVLGDGANMLRAKELDDAQNTGENAVFRTPDGQLQVALKSNLGQVDRAYNRGAMQGYMARLSGDVRSSGAKISQDSKGDPTLFDSAWKGFQKQIIGAAPKEMRGAAQTLLETEGARFGLGVQEEKRTRDLKVAEGNIKAEISSLDDEMSALAQKGGTNTDAYHERQAQVKSLVGEMVANPEFSLGDKEAAIQLKRMESRHLGYALIGSVDAVLNKDGVGAARKMSEGILTDTTLDLSPAERRSFSSMMDERINGTLAVRKAELEPLKAEATTIKERLKLGIGINADDIDVLATKLARGGDAAGAWDLRISRSIAWLTSQFRGMSNKDQVAALEKAKAGSNNYVGQVNADGTISTATQNAAPEGLISAGNIDLHKRPVVKNDDGSISTVRSISFEEDGKEILIPTVSPDGKILSDDDAIALYHKTGENLGVFKDAKSATAYANDLHQQQAKEYLPASPANGASEIRAPANVRNAISQAAQRHGVSPTALMKIAQIESSMNPNAKNPNSSAAGLFQFTDGTAAQYGLQDKYSAGESADAAARLMKDNGDYLRKTLGREPTDGELYLAHQQGAGGAAKLLANPNASAVDVVGADAVQLNGGDASMTAGQFAAKWVNQVDGGSVNISSSPDYSGLDPELVKEMQSEITGDAKSLFADMKAGFEKSYAPSGEDVNLLTRQLSMVDDQDFRNEVKTYMESEAAAATLKTMPTQDREMLMSALNAQASDGVSVAAQTMLGAMERTNTAITEQIAKDPIGYAAQRNMASTPDPLNFADPQALASGFGGRQKAVDALAAGGVVDGASALRPSDLKDMQAFMAKATPQEQAQVLAVMGQTLKPDTMRVTTAALAGKDGTNGFAAAGALYGDNPEAAEGVLRGFQLLQQNPKLAPKDDDTFKSAISEVVPMSIFAVGTESNRQSLLEAARARYADLSSQAGDESQNFDSTRYEKAVNEVTGGFIYHNGEPVIAPMYGMQQGDFDALLKSQGPQLMAGAVTSEGATITMETVINEGKLKAIGPGEYLVEFQGGTYAHQLVDPNEGLKFGTHEFILDLRGKK